ncbi:hypothetical protein ETD83_25490 [Actinomadura soli]|uniref:Uncharacterized protein n=1 Tax=Actinomadura soli TaxID=2508997 RepID=A0A5C4J6Q4_9ACTN|nr:hypothetical protein [Actinomadura soli]TMQ93465.1 hypothetical protein ETD83_25490 [Actinomadura soli]
MPRSPPASRARRPGELAEHDRARADYAAGLVAVILLATLRAGEAPAGPGPPGRRAAAVHPRKVTRNDRRGA